jgi:hypothetical protein
VHEAVGPDREDVHRREHHRQRAEKAVQVQHPGGLGRVQVKARVIRSGTAGERQHSPLRSFDFDLLLVLGPIFGWSCAVRFETI